ncbi:MAG: preprotein translocase subunit SecA [Ruminococcus sp.]|nr:preprotein translocase subunit SecA [Ruminococcus sp.]
MANFLKALFGSYSKREIKRVQPLCDKTLALEDKYSAMTDKELKAQTTVLKERLAKGESTDDILPDAFAVCREASWRVLGMKHFPVQILGGIILHQGRIAEMKTGEGKTLVATLPAYLNALTGEGVHIVTVNDYLARRDSEWMGKLYRFLGLTVGLIVHDITPDMRQAAYNADITYGTNNEFGFDYLRDNMAVYKEQRVQRGHAFAVVDEVDSILIDEARTPLIISGKGDKSTDMYQRAEAFACRLKKYVFTEVNNKEDMEAFFEENGIDYIVDEKAKSATLTQVGVKKAEAHFGVENLTDPDNLTLQHHINLAIRAHGIMHLDIDYVNKDGEIIIVDEFTGRLMYGRRFNEGLHQAIEAKEGVEIQNENKTLATITFQNYFRLYKKLSGMTGTAMTEEQEFREIYKLDVVEIPTNRPLARQDMNDCFYATQKAKYEAVIDTIVRCHEKGQPVLVGTISIEKSELLSKMLSRRGVAHNVLNAKQHEKEAEIVAQAGKLGAVTIATNMAGRGTDIILGGNAEFMATSKMRKQGFTDELIAEATGFAETDNEEIIEARRVFSELHTQFKDELREEAEKVRAAGGLFIIGTERHESRRIDNQLRGRAGRQGDPGQSQFFLSAEDDLMRIFGGDRMKMLMDRFAGDESVAIDIKLFSNVIENAQQKVEQSHFGARKNVLQFDDVMNRQREIIYKQRNQVLDGEDIHETIMTMIEQTISANVEMYLSGTPDNWNLISLREYYNGWLADDDKCPLVFEDEELAELTASDVTEILLSRAQELYAEFEALITKETMREVERVCLLRAVDTHWMEHIDDMDELKQGIRMRAYAQHDPVVEYTHEGFEMFDQMIDTIRQDTVKLVFTMPLSVHAIKRRQEEEENRRREAEKAAAARHEVIICGNTEPAKVNPVSFAIKREQVAKPVEFAGDGTMSTNKTVKKGKKVGRNDPCPCGSGKKYKKCCGMNE